MDLEAQLVELYNSLGEFGATDRAPQQLIDLFNVLLDEAKKTKPDHPIVASIKPIEPHGLGTSINSGGLRALAQQLLSALS